MRIVKPPTAYVPLETLAMLVGVKGERGKGVAVQGRVESLGCLRMTGVWWRLRIDHVTPSKYLHRVIWNFGMQRAKRSTEAVWGSLEHRGGEVGCGVGSSSADKFPASRTQATIPTLGHHAFHIVFDVSQNLQGWTLTTKEKNGAQQGGQAHSNLGLDVPRSAHLGLRIAQSRAQLKFYSALSLLTRSIRFSLSVPCIDRVRR